MGHGPIDMKVFREVLPWKYSRLIQGAVVITAYFRVGAESYLDRTVEMRYCTNEALLGYRARIIKEKN